MAIAGGGIPSFPISLGPDNRVQVWLWATNKPEYLVERDIDRAVERLLAGERFEMYCSGPQVMRINDRLEERSQSVGDNQKTEASQSG